LLRLDITVKDKKVSIDNIVMPESMLSLLDGGVYKFLIDNQCLYVGETSSFMIRFADHMTGIQKDSAYFGLERLDGEYSLRYEILERGLPYKKSEEKAGRRYVDENSLVRKKKEIEYINTLFPVLQNPNKTTNRRSDHMVTDKTGTVRNDLVYNLLNSERG